MEIDPQLQRDGDTQRPLHMPTQPTLASSEYPEPPSHTPINPNDNRDSVGRMQAHPQLLIGTEHGKSTSDPEHEAKRSRACEPCRQLKVRCDPDPTHPEGSCKRCAKARRTCIVTAPTRKRQKKTDSRVAELERKIDALTATLQTSNSTGALFSRSSPREEPGQGWSGETKIAGSKRQASGEVKESGGMLAPRYSRPGSPSAEQIPTASKQWRRPVADEWAPPTKPEASNEFADMIDRGIISHNTANLAFERYVVQMAPELPFVVFPPGTTMGEVRRNKPFLFLSIIAASVNVFDPDAQPILVNELYRMIAEQVVVKGYKSLELVQTIMVCAIWYMPPDNLEELKFYSLTHMAALMGMELGLNRGVSDKKRFNMIRELITKKPTEPAFDPDGPEVRRTWVGCYYLASQMAAAMRRVNLITWQPYMDECLEILETHPDALPSDRNLKWWANLGRIMEDAGKQFTTEDRGATTTLADSKVWFDMKILEERIARWRADIPRDIYTGAMIHTEHVLSLFVHELAMRVNYNTSDDSKLRDNPNNHYMATAVDALKTAIRCIHQSIDTICQVEAERLISLPTASLARTSYPVVCLIKIYSLFMTCDNNFARILDVQSLKLDYYLDKVIAHYRSAAERNGGRSAAKFGNIMVLLRNWFIKKRDQGDKGRELKEVFSNSETKSVPKLNAPSQDTPNPPTKPLVQISQCMTPLHFLSEVAMGDPSNRVNDSHTSHQISGPGYTASHSPISAGYGDPSLSSLSQTKPSSQTRWSAGPSYPSYPSTLPSSDPTEMEPRGYYESFADPPQSYPELQSGTASTQPDYPDMSAITEMQLAPPIGMDGIGADPNLGDPWSTLGNMMDEGLFTLPLYLDGNFGLF